MSNKYFDIDDEGKRLFITQTAQKTGLPKEVVEKDLWVTIVLQLVFKLPYADRTIFKGGSSLSKVWDLIGRMSEDVDLAYDSNFGIFEGDEPTVKQIKKLRKQSSLFVQNEFCEALKVAISEAGLDKWCCVEAQANGIGNATYPEPRQLYVTYKSLFTDNMVDAGSTYVKPIVMLEVSSRSLIEPTGKAKVKSMIAREFGSIDTDVANVEIRTALPEKTFLEKVFLLHEMFVTPRCQRAERKTRHLYDIEQMMDKDFALRAVKDDELWNSINRHRARFSSIHGVDYTKDLRKEIRLTPPENVIALWEEDYKYMRTNMIYDNTAISFADLMARMHELEERFHQNQMSV